MTWNNSENTKEATVTLHLRCLTPTHSKKPWMYECLLCASFRRRKHSTQPFKHSKVKFSRSNYHRFCCCRFSLLECDSPAKIFHRLLSHDWNWLTEGHLVLIVGWHERISGLRPLWQAIFVGFASNQGSNFDENFNRVIGHFEAAFQSNSMT